MSDMIEPTKQFSSAELRRLAAQVNSGLISEALIYAALINAKSIAKAKRISELEAEVAALRLDAGRWFPANLANAPTGDLSRKVLVFWDAGDIDGTYTAEELVYHITAHANHGDHWSVAKAWAEYPMAAIDAAIKEQQ